MANTDLLKVAFEANNKAFDHFCNYLEKATGPISEDLVNVARCIMQVNIALRNTCMVSLNKEEEKVTF